MLSFLKNIRIEQPPEVELVPERCLRRRLGTYECRLCLDVCASGALSLVDRQLQLDPTKCTGCLACAAVCPNEALVPECDLEEVLRTVREEAGKPLAISCSRKKQLSAEEIVVPCLGIFAEESLVALGMSGCPAIIFNLAGCSACANNQAAARFLTVLGRVQGIAAKVFSTGLSAADGLEQEPVGNAADRRSFLAGLRAHLATIAKVRPEAGSTSRSKTSGRRLPDRVKIIGRVIAAASAESRAQLLALCTHRVTAGPGCDSCPLCTGICPTGALHTSGYGAEKQLLFSRTRCSGCGLCVAFCKKAALALSFSPLSGREPAGATTIL